MRNINLDGYMALKNYAKDMRSHNPSVWEGLSPREIIACYVATGHGWLDWHPERVSTCVIEWFLDGDSMLAVKFSENEDGPIEIIAGLAAR